MNISAMAYNETAQRKIKRGLARIEHRINGFKTSGIPLHQLVMSDAENLMISSNLVWTPPVVGISQTGPKSELK